MNAQAAASPVSTIPRPRTIVTADPELDDLNSMIENEVAEAVTALRWASSSGTNCWSGLFRGLRETQVLT